ncbi:tyrosine-type recombinase/integrase [Sphingobacterium multivorum]|uniref:tyrosine-type recombinase/integrase n=1 Tax=Sphingobacterium multivorum TaxID=28454 RepID=UPI0031BB1FD6
MDFEAYLKGEKLKESTIAQHVLYVGYFQLWSDKEGLTLQQTSQREVLDFIGHQKTEGRSVNQLNRILLSLRYWFSYLNKRNIVNSNPASGLQVKGAVRNVPTGLLERNELDNLYESYTAKDDRTYRNKTMLGLLVYQALTLEELEKLRPENLKLREGKVTIPETTNNAGRTLDLKPFQILDLQEYILVIRPRIQSQSERLFTGRNDLEKLKNTLLHLCYALKRINPKVKHATQIRQSVITEWLKEKGLRQVQYMAGHRYVSSTERYLTTNLEDLREALNKHHPLK